MDARDPTPPTDEEHVVEPEEELALTEQPDGDLVIDDAALGTWSTNPDYLQAADEDEPGR